ncbi:hypothetical protein NMG60_11020315 [Bertholletia excelsa]
MDDQCSPLSWAYLYQEEETEELKHSLLYTTLELETTILCAHEEIARKEAELIHLKDILTKTIKERDDAQEKCQTLKLEKVILQQQLHQQLQRQFDHLPSPGTIKIEEEKGFSSSNSNENISESPGTEPIPQLAEKLAANKPLPENGKFLKAVMEAGPLLQTLLLAGPLPQWHNPPPRVNSLEIPPVTIPSPPRKRVLVDSEAPDSSPNTKYQKLVHQSPLTNGWCFS